MSRFEIKIVATLLGIAVIPLVASVILVGQVIRVSNSVAAGQTQRLSVPLSHAADAYRALFVARRRVFLVSAKLLARDAALLSALGSSDREGLSRRVAELVRSRGFAGLGRLAIRGPDGKVWASAQNGKQYPAARFRDLEVNEPLGGGHLDATFYTPRAPFLNFRALGRAQRAANEITTLRDELSSIYRWVFLIMFGAVLLVATGVGIFVARRTTRQVAVLSGAVQEVAEGDLRTQVEVKGRDELADLARAFNEMVGQLRENRERIGYLEKIGAWQEIARRLAHEIKNPLTPIQLAMQQVHRKYEGDDPRFRKMLDDAHAIITEEVEGLRRLVQAFSSFARLPNVQPEPVDINALLEDFFKSHVEVTQRCKEVRWREVEPVVQVMVDRMLMKHVIYNLVENAVQAAEDAGTSEALEVEISAKRDGQRVTLQVRDNGPGMPDDVRKRIFNPYYTTKERGTGLGLAIVKKIVLEHGGSIGVDSVVGEGSTFTIRLLAVDTELEAATVRTTISRLLRDAPKAEPR
ncbi:MAG: HAMP domain-containing protein [Myxococcales bacterium]|nr:HAMP domain-containing protein [Myxococcales bacterium]